MENFNISTSLICCDLSNIADDLDIIIEHEGFNWLHADFMDGHFVPRYGISPELIQCLRKRYGNRVIIDSHLMVSNPMAYVDTIACYSDWVFFHYEAMHDPLRLLQFLRKNYPALKIGVTLNISTPVDAIRLLYKANSDACRIGNMIDGVMFMGISPGVLGTMAFPDVVESKIEDTKFLFNDDLQIFIDGSVNFNTVNRYKELGANVCVTGSSMMFKQDDNAYEPDRRALIQNNIQKIKTTIYEK